MKNAFFHYNPVAYEIASGGHAKISGSILCILPSQQHRLLPVELPGDHKTHLFLADHFVDLFVGDPAGIHGLAGEQHHILNGYLALQTILIEMGVAIHTGIDQLKIFLGG